MDWPLKRQRYQALPKNSRKRIGVGGSVVNGEILLQGDHRTAVQTYLSSAGFEVRSVAARHTILITASELADELKRGTSSASRRRFNLLDPEKDEHNTVRVTFPPHCICT